MSWIDTVENQLKAHVNAVHGIETIAGLARIALTAEGQPGAADAIGTILSVAEALINGFTGAAMPDDVKASLDAFAGVLTKGIAANDAAADAALDQKFDKSP